MHLKTTTRCNPFEGPSVLAHIVSIIVKLSSYKHSGSPTYQARVTNIKSCPITALSNKTENSKPVRIMQHGMKVPTSQKAETDNNV